MIIIQDMYMIAGNTMSRELHKMLRVKKVVIW